MNTFTTPDALGGLNVRVVTIDGEPWFVAKDACQVLGMNLKAGTRQWTRGLSDDDRRLVTVKGHPELFSGSPQGGASTLTIISESGLYRLIMRSDKPEARQFQDWVTRHVLPTPWVVSTSAS